MDGFFVIWLPTPGSAAHPSSRAAASIAATTIGRSGASAVPLVAVSGAVLGHSIPVKMNLSHVATKGSGVLRSPKP